MPSPPPPLERLLYDRPHLTQEQQIFYDLWREALEGGQVWVTAEAHKEVMINYVYTYAKDLVVITRDNPPWAAERLERLTLGYQVVEDLAGDWASDAWLLAGDLVGAYECLPRLKPEKVRAYGADRRLLLKLLLNLPLEALDLLTMFTPNITGIVASRLDDLVEHVDIRLRLEHQEGRDLIGEFYQDLTLETFSWPLFNATVHSVQVDGARVGRVSGLSTARDVAYSMQRAAENAVREDLQLPHVGQGWVSETQLFRELERALDTNVVQHGVPDGFGRQHLDVWIPEWKIGVEYHGPQHDGPVEFFGGQAGYEMAAQRDREKVTKAQQLGIEIVYVRPGYTFKEVLDKLAAARERTKAFGR
jgi:hypothetical protein